MIHTPVLLNEVLDAFRVLKTPTKRILEGTFGRGGHTAALLKTFSDMQIVSFDRDGEAIEYGKSHFQNEIKSGRLTLIRDDYRHMNRHDLGKFDGAFLDLGVSSPQLDDAHRGFSFMNDGPLDMRMDRGQDTTAADIINEFSEEELNDLFKTLGEIRSPYRVVRAIVHDRKTEPYKTTRELASLIERVEGFGRRHSHPATNYFMALRLKVNKELDDIDRFIKSLPASVNEGGRLAIISFHSTEDRIVKNAFKEMNKKDGLMVNKKVITGSREEVKSNPRSRSAKLRIFEVGKTEVEE